LGLELVVNQDDQPLLQGCEVLATFDPFIEQDRTGPIQRPL
jgi:hypothetical protein